MADGTHSLPQTEERPAPASVDVQQASAFIPLDLLDETRDQDQFVSLCVHLIGCANLRATSTEKPVRRRRLRAKVFVDPGNQSATSNVLTIEDSSSQTTWDEIIALRNFSLACIKSLVTFGVCDLVIEVWEIGSSEFSHEQVGAGRIPMQKVVERQSSEPFELALARTSGRGFAGKLTLNATLDFDSSSSLTPFSPSLFAECANEKRTSGEGTLTVAAIACGGLEVSLLSLRAMCLCISIVKLSICCVLWRIDLARSIRHSCTRRWKQATTI